MPTITIDGKKIECREGIPVLQAALEAGWDVPHYCYHPGLTVVASCRLCLMEMKLPHPQTKEMDWVPKLFPSCQTPVKEGMEVRFDAQRVADNSRHVMEYYLINHPLDCPVCDKAGECYLQDYTETVGPANSRMVEEKQKNPKKDIGSKTLLYQDRCVLCSRCVRFAQEVAGTGELAVVNRGNRSEIDVFPGLPLENALQGNVVDLCPVGALLSKDFLFKQRVWLLEETPSVCNLCSRGCTTRVDHNEEGLHRVRPRFNEKVNEWWICDIGRFDWKYVNRPDRLTTPQQRRGSALEPARWEELVGVLHDRFREAAATDQGTTVAAVLSPFLSCEEAWLLARYVRSVAPQATLVGGYVPIVGSDQTFPKGFVIRAERCPNRRGIETLISKLGGPALGWDAFLKQAGEGKFKAAYVTGGYPEPWMTSEHAKSLGRIPFLVTHDLFPTPLDSFAAIQIPAAAVVEREGTFMNRDGLLQAFERARLPLEGIKGDGQFLAELAGEVGLFRAARVRQKMVAEIPDFAAVFVPKDEPKYAH